MRPSRLIPTMFFALVLAAFATAAAPPAAQLEWPGTEIAGRARAWFAQLAGSEEEARRFFAEHLAPSALAEAGVDVRMERRHGMIERTGGLTPLEVVDDTPSELAVRCSAGNGDHVTATFHAESAAPHRLLGVTLEAGDDTGGPGRRAPAPQGVQGVGGTQRAEDEGDGEGTGGVPHRRAEVQD